MTPFLSEHPGGKKVVLKEAGKDATAKFDMFHKADILAKCVHLRTRSKLILAGTALRSSSASSVPPPLRLLRPLPRRRLRPLPALPLLVLHRRATVRPAPRPPASAPWFPTAIPLGARSGTAPTTTTRTAAFGAHDSTDVAAVAHCNVSAAMREFVEKEIMPFAFEWDEKKAMPRDMYGRWNLFL